MLYPLFFRRVKIERLVFPDEPLEHKPLQDRSGPVRIFTKFSSVNDFADFFAGKPGSRRLLHHSKDFQFHSVSSIKAKPGPVDNPKQPAGHSPVALFKSAIETFARRPANWRGGSDARRRRVWSSRPKIS